LSDLRDPATLDARFATRRSIRSRRVWSKVPPTGRGQARARIAGQSTPYVAVEPALSHLGDFAAFVADEPGDQTQWADALKAELIGRPVGDKAWVRELEIQLSRDQPPVPHNAKQLGPGNAVAQGD